MKFICITFALMIAVTQTSNAQWVQQSINTTADFRGLCAISSDVAWVSGTKGTVGRTLDGGKTWEVITVPGAEKLDFRDIEAFSKDVAYILSIGSGENSRIYKTTDGGKQWKLQFTNDNPKAFYDALAFWDEQHGVAISDPVDGKFRLLITSDGGANWKPILSANMPDALEGEGAFAASGACLLATGTNDIWFVTGGASAARLFHSPDKGRNWTVLESKMQAGVDSRGIFSLAFKDRSTGMMVGGDYKIPLQTNQTWLLTTNGGISWEAAEKPSLLPFCSCVVWAGNHWIAVGTTGSFQSQDGKKWNRIDAENYNVVSAGKDGSTWAAGPKSRIATLKN
ncbi:MAG: glycosyl hydrolase [Planctomycetia bacterium]|nr:glycosyl hydrolase [Planctomycetia bacterium]